MGAVGVSPVNVEIERKFLVRNEDWRGQITGRVALRDGLLASASGRKVRVRASGDTATLTVKGGRRGIARDEFEYAIPIADANELLLRHCDGNIFEKTRFYVPFAGYTWEVDVYRGLLDGVVIAELELPHAEAAFVRPHWVGDEVTFDQRYRKLTMFKRRLAEQKSASGVEAGA